MLLKRVSIPTAKSFISLKSSLKRTTPVTRLAPTAAQKSLGAFTRNPVRLLFTTTLAPLANLGLPSRVKHAEITTGLLAHPTLEVSATQFQSCNIPAFANGDTDPAESGTPVEDCVVSPRWRYEGVSRGRKTNREPPGDASKGRSYTHPLAVFVSSY